MTRTVLVFAALTFGGACTFAQEAAAETRPDLVLVTGEVILPPGVEPRMIRLDVTPTDGPQPRVKWPRFARMVVPGKASISVDLSEWYWGTPGRDRRVVKQQIEVHPDGSTIPPCPIVIDVESMVRTVWVEVQDEAGSACRNATIGPLAPALRDTGWRNDTRPIIRLDAFQITTGKDGREAVLVPEDEETPSLVVFKPGFRSVSLPKVGPVNRVVLRKGVTVHCELPDWLRLPPSPASCIGPIPVSFRDVRIVLVPAPDEGWWKSRTISLYDGEVTTGGRTPRSVEFTVDPGTYRIECRLDRETLMRMKGDSGEQITVSPGSVTILDTSEKVTLKLDLDRKAYRKSGFADLEPLGAGGR